VRRDRLGYDVRKPEALTLRLVPETGVAQNRGRALAALAIAVLRKGYHR